MQETAEWRKPAKQREAEEIKEDHEKFVSENPELVEDLFANEIAELGFDPSKWKRNYASNPEPEAAEVSLS